MGQNMTGGRVREHVAQLDVPPEPPAGSVVISSADGRVRQSRRLGEGDDGPIYYQAPGDFLGFGSMTWPKLLSYGAVEVIWRPDADMPDDSTRGAALDLLAAIAPTDVLVTDVEVREAAARLRARLVGDQVADASGAPG